MKRIFFGLIALMLLIIPQLSTPTFATPSQQSACLFYTETGGGQGGYSVCDDASANFRTAFQQWGLQKIGYPVSQRYERDGFITQAFQKAIMQWRPDSQSVALVNIFDDLHRAGFDQKLLDTRQVPKQLPDGWDGEGLTFEQTVSKRQALLDERPALRAAYFSSSNPLTFFGLPTSEVQDMDNHYAIRLQRAVLQEWKETVPWAQAGEVTIANGGDLAKELAALPPSALAPVPENAESEANDAPTEEPSAPPVSAAATPTLPPSFPKTVPLGQEFVTTLWGLKIYDVKRAKAVYFGNSAEIAHGTYLIPLVEFRNLGSGTAKPHNNLDFYLQDGLGRTFDYDTFNDAVLGAGRQFQAGHLYDSIHPGSKLGITLPFDISPEIGDIWLRVRQDAEVIIYLGNVSQMPESR
jgi:hypothetical protein